MTAKFETTCWSAVLRAAEEGDDASEMLEWLCRTYWYPLYAFVRRRGYEAERARDLTQSFFLTFLQKGYVKQVDRDRGRFRSFLLAAMKHFLSHERDAENAQKRRGDSPLFQDELREGETRYATEASLDLDPEVLYERRWAATIVARATSRLVEALRSEGKTALADHARKHLLGLEDRALAEVAKELSMTVNALRVTFHRLRKRMGRLLREEVAQTLDDADHVDDEVRHLLGVLAQGAGAGYD